MRRGCVAGRLAGRGGTDSLLCRVQGQEKGVPPAADKEERALFFFQRGEGALILPGVTDRGPIDFQDYVPLPQPGFFRETAGFNPADDDPFESLGEIQLPRGFRGEIPMSRRALPLRGTKWGLKIS